MDAVGLAGGPTRPPRGPLGAAERKVLDTASPPSGSPSRRERPLAFRAVDSHTEGMPTRVVTAGVDPIPGATMLERKLHFEAHMDDLRLCSCRSRAGTPR
jgi:hypothetical protein